MANPADIHTCTQAAQPAFDHNESLESKLAAPVQEPIYQMQMMDGKWIDQAKQSYEYNKAHGHTVRIVYTTPPTQPAPEVTNLATAIEYADARWSGVDVPIEWARHFADAIGKPYTTPPAQPAPVPLTDDPLQGAVDWFLQADGEYFCTANVQRTLRIGYNRAKRLCDTAKERAAHGITKGQP
jgi:hypothetical protein